MKINSLLLISLVLFSKVSAQNINSINASLNTAKFLEKGGDIDGAISIYQGILEKNPKHAISIHKIKSIYLSYERYSEGIQFINKLLKDDPFNMRLHSELGEIHYLNNDKQKAEQVWSSSINKFKSNRSFFRIMVSMYGKYGLDNKIEEVLKKGKKKFGKSFLSYESGVYFQARGAYDKAMDQFILYLMHEPKQNGIIERRILLMSDEEEALSTIEKKLIEASENTPTKILNVLSEYYFKRQKYEQSFRKKKEWSFLVKNNTNEWFEFANELRKESQFDYAIKSYNHIIKESFSPNVSGKALLGLAKTFEDQIIPAEEDYLIPYFYDNNLFFKDPYGVYSRISTDNLSSSIALYDSMLVTLDRSPLIAEAFFKLGEIQYRMLQDFDKAYVLFSKAMKNKPNKVIKLNTILRIADVLIARGELDEAKSFLARQLKSNQIPTIELKRILVHFLDDDPDTTLNMVNAALLKLTPVNPFFNDIMELKNLINKYYDSNQQNRSAFIHFIKAENYLRQKKLGDAMQELLFAIDEFPNSKVTPIMNLRLALINLKLNNYDNALSFALSLENTDLADKGIILSGQIYQHKLMDLEKALKQYMRILDEFPSSIYSEPIRYHIRNVGMVKS